MTSLRVIFWFSPPTKNPGYAYASRTSLMFFDNFTPNFRKYACAWLLVPKLQSHGLLLENHFLK